MTFPTIQGRDGLTSGTADATSFTVAFAAGWDTSLAGDRVYCFVSADEKPALSSATPGWILVDQRAVTTQVAGAVFVYEAAADNAAIPDLVVASDTAQQFSARMLWVRSSTGVLAHFEASTGGSAAVTPDPPAVINSTGATQDCLVVAGYNGDGTPQPSAAPSGYANLGTQAAGGANGATTSTAEKNVTLAAGAAENPGVFAFPGALDQWDAFTIAIYEVSAGAGGTIKAWDGSAWAPKPVKVWDGSNWTLKPVKFHNGSGWTDA